jgi:hypothetical protein
MCPFAPTAIALAGSIGFPPPRSRTGTSFKAASERTRWHSSYPESLGMSTSARMMSGFCSRAFCNAASPSSQVTS